MWFELVVRLKQAAPEPCVHFTRCICEEKMDLFCGLMQRRRRRREIAPVQGQGIPEPELFESDAEGQSYFSKVSTFAKVTINDRRRSSRQVIQTMPYFGPFAGRNVTFVVDDSKTSVRVDKVKISTRLDMTHGSGSVKDRCINFLHSTGRQETHFEYNVPPPQPHRLKFLCMRHILLSGVLPPGTPMAEAAKIDSTPKQTVFVNVWPSSVAVRQGSGGVTEPLKIRVPARITFGELMYFVREKLSLSSSYAVHFREPEGIYELSPPHPLKFQHNELECFVKVPPVCPTSPRPSPLPVMMIGHGIGEVEVTPSTTVLELESAIAEHFGLRANSFVFLPALFSPQIPDSCGLRMYVSGNRQSAMAFIDRQSRRFPIVLDDDPSLEVDHRRLPLYSRTLSEVGLLYNELPLLCFNITGPTVPLSFRAANVTSSGSGSRTGENFMGFTIETRIISINPNWTASTLLKYIDCISRLPNKKLIHGDSVIPHDQVIGKLFAREWIVTGPNGRKAISPSILKVS